MRRQRGTIYKRNGWWVLRYRETLNQDGELKITQPARQLAPLDPKYRGKKPPASVRQLGDEFLAQINHSQQEPLQVVTLRNFMESVFLPFVKVISIL
jgi:hypothetical protein